MVETKLKELATQAAHSDIKAETAIKIVKDLLKAAASSEDFTSQLKLKINEKEKNYVSGIPCVVCIKTPFGSYCAVPPGGDC